MSLAALINELIPLDSSRLLKNAIRRSGSARVEVESLEEPLKMLIASCSREANLNFAGRMACRNFISELLVARFKMLDYWSSNPDIQEQRIYPQIFITGLPKSGSTFLHRLLAHDVRNRAPMMWEVMYPLPTGLSGLTRLKKAQMRLMLARLMNPALARSHPIGAHIPQECGPIFGYTLESDVFVDMFYVPSYESWLRKRDLTPVYEFHKSFLRHLQWKQPERRWVLKSSDHVRSLDILLRAYPEARIIFLHRDPLRVLLESSTQQALLKGVFSGSVDRKRIALYEEKSLYEKTQKIMEFRRKRDDLSGRFVDIRYLDLSSDPIGTVRSIYDHFGFCLSRESEARMRDFVDSVKKEKILDKMSPTDMGIDVNKEYALFEDYCALFHVEREVF